MNTIKWAGIDVYSMGAQTQAVKEYTTIRVTPDVADELHDQKERGESYDDVLRRILDLGEYQE